jgi:4-amino-4-deoxy-L-arabinose transferase-like glycosyltransferase
VRVRLPPPAILSAIQMQSKITNRGYPLAKAILICAGFAVLYLLIAGSSTLWDRDEPRYARVTAEMIESGNYLVPTFNGEAWPDKPILLYWLMSIPVRIFGPSEIACRFAGIMGTAVTLLLTFFIGKKLFDAKAGLWAEAILATTLLMMFMGSSAIVDGVALPFIVGAMAVFVGRTGGKIQIVDAVIIGVLMGMGMLAKGPIGLLPAPVMLVSLWFARKNGIELLRNLVSAALMIIVAAGIFLMWAIPVNKATGGEFVRVFLGHHIFSRALSPMESHGGNFFLYLPYYPAVIIAGFFPWVLFLPGAFSAVTGKRIGTDGGRNILISWIVATVILMTLAATKLPHYVLFVWPAMAVMVGGTITAVGENILKERDRKWLRGGVWFFMPVGLGVAAGLIGVGYFLKIEGLKLPGLICGLVMLAMTAICGILQIHEKFVASAKVVLAGVVILLAPLLLGLLPAIEEIKISPHIAKAVREKTSKNMPVAMYKYAEPTLNFYIGRQITHLREEDDVVEWLKGTGNRALIIPRKDFESIRQKTEGIEFEEIASKKGLNYSKGREVEVVALLVKTETRQ